MLGLVGVPPIVPQLIEEYGQCRNLIKKPWAFIRVLSMIPNLLGVIGPLFLIRLAF